MLFRNENAQFLVQIGFTEAQAKLYLALLRAGKTDAKTLQKLTKAPRPVVYRTLNELQEKGLVETEIATPHSFRATPIHLAMKIIVKQKMKDYRETENKTEEFLRKFQPPKEETAREEEYRFTILDGKERIIQKMKQQHDSTHFSIDILSTLPRWLQIIEECFENYKKALSRGVKYRVIVEKADSEVSLSKNVQALLANPNFKLKVTSDSRQTNSAIFDRKEATFNYYPSKSLGESPLILTNHPSFMAMCQDHFETIWKLARKYKTPLKT
jgi:sugar-specific transcriptional regulator TrmB